MENYWLTYAKLNLVEFKDYKWVVATHESRE
jgi:hypothetical protein